jgi:hypothetical protein
MGVSSSTFAARIGDSRSDRVTSAGVHGAEAGGRSRVPSVRAQTAIVRALADALKHHTARGDATESLREQLVEELARLGLRPSRDVVGDR